MVTDTSALVCVILLEAESNVIGPKLLSQPSTMAAPNLLEAHMVLKGRFGEETTTVLQENLARFGITVVPFTPEHAEEAMRAFDRFGKGRHPARLNFGDCVAYALAKSSGQPLLFVGDDFTKTDVLAA